MQHVACAAGVAGGAGPSLGDEPALALAVGLHGFCIVKCLVVCFVPGRRAEVGGGGGWAESEPLRGGRFLFTDFAAGRIVYPV